MKHSSQILDKLRPKFNFRMNKALSDFTIKTFVDNDDGYYKIDFEVYLKTKKKNLQRPLVWTLQQKQELILSVLKGISFPPLTIVRHDADEKRNDVTLKIIDGKQRITTLVDFYNNGFSVFIGEVDYYYKDLDEYAQYIFRSVHIKTDVIYEYYDQLIPDDELIAYFEMINFSGTPQDIDHLKNLKKNID